MSPILPAPLGLSSWSLGGLNHHAEHNMRDIAAAAGFINHQSLLLELPYLYYGLKAIKRFRLFDSAIPILGISPKAAHSKVCSWNPKFLTMLMGARNKRRE